MFYSHLGASIRLRFEWDCCCGHHIISVLIGGDGKHEVLAEGLVQQSENLPALTVVGQIRPEAQTSIRLTGVRMFLLQEQFDY